MQGPASYRLEVRGQLDADWSDRLAGMDITHSRRPDGEVATTLVGRLADQAALSGVLNALYELHLPVLSVECLGSGWGSRRTRPTSRARCTGRTRS